MIVMKKIIQHRANNTYFPFLLFLSADKATLTLNDCLFQQHTAFFLCLWCSHAICTCSKVERFGGDPQDVTHNLSVKSN